MYRLTALLLLAGCGIGRNTLPPCDVVVTVVDGSGQPIPTASATLESGDDCLIGCGFFEEDPDESLVVEAPGYEDFTADIGFGDCTELEVVLVEAQLG